jgi:putative lipoprotein
MLKKTLSAASLILLTGIVLAACGIIPSTGDRLMSEVWTLQSMVSGGADVALEDGVTTTIQFSEDGTYSGNGGCNSYSGSYTIEGNSISLGVAASTLVACATGMEQEAAFFAALPEVTNYEVTAEGMRLQSEDRSVALLFVASSDG